MAERRPVLPRRKGAHQSVPSHIETLTVQNGPTLNSDNRSNCRTKNVTDPESSLTSFACFRRIYLR